MQRQDDLHIFSGMQQDTSVSKQMGNYLQDARNIRIITTGNNTTLSITNERGPAVMSQEYKGICLGYGILNNKVVVFTTESVTVNCSDIFPQALQSETYAVNTDSEQKILKLDRIYVTQINGDDATTECIYPYKESDYVELIDNVGDKALWKTDWQEIQNMSLNFDTEHPIETLPIYEAENVQKIYWTDNLNQPRMINIAVDDAIRQKWNKNSFDFLPELKLQERVSVERKEDASGAFAPGVIQYAFSYYNLYGQESNIFFITSLLYVGYENRAGSPEEKIQNAFSIKVDNVDTNFQYLRIYSIQRTSIEGTPIVRRVADIDLSKINNYTAVFTDNGLYGETIDPSALLFIGGEEIAVETMCQKDNTLFMGNITIKRPQIAQDIRDIIRKEFKNLVHCKYKSHKVDYLSRIPYPQEKHGSHATVETSYKANEYYRLGIQFQYKNGRWSEPCYIDDFQQTKYPYMNTVNQKKGDDNYLATYKYLPIFTIIPIKKVDGTDSYERDSYWIQVMQALKDAGYKRLRLLTVFPKEDERTVICQGVANPTIYTNDMRSTNKLHSQASWFFRPMTQTGSCLAGAENTMQTSPQSRGALVNDNATVAGRCVQQRGGSGNLTYDRRFTNHGCGVEFSTAFFNGDVPRIDWSFLTINSPECDDVDNFYYTGVTNTHMFHVGDITVDRTLACMDLKTDTPPIAGSGFKEKIQFVGKGPCGIISSYCYNDDIVDDWKDRYGSTIKVDGRKLFGDESSKLVDWLVFAWQRPGSLNNDAERRADMGTKTADLKKKTISNLRVSDNTVYFGNYRAPHGTNDNQEQTQTQEQIQTIVSERELELLGNPKYFHSKHLEIEKINWEIQQTMHDINNVEKYLYTLYSAVYMGNSDFLVGGNRFASLYFKNALGIFEMEPIYLEAYDQSIVNLSDAGVEDELSELKRDGTTFLSNWYDDKFYKSEEQHIEIIDGTTNLNETIDANSNSKIGIPGYTFEFWNKLSEAEKHQYEKTRSILLGFSEDTQNANDNGEQIAIWSSLTRDKIRRIYPDGNYQVYRASDSGDYDANLGGKNIPVPLRYRSTPHLVAKIKYPFVWSTINTFDTTTMNTTKRNYFMNGLWSGATYVKSGDVQAYAKKYDDLTGILNHLAFSLMPGRAERHIVQLIVEQDYQTVLDVDVDRQNDEQEHLSYPRGYPLYDDNLNMDNILPVVELRKDYDESTMFGGKTEQALMDNIWIPAGESVYIGSLEQTIQDANIATTRITREALLNAYPVDNYNHGDLDDDDSNANQQQFDNEGEDEDENQNETEQTLDRPVYVIEPEDSSNISTDPFNSHPIHIDNPNINNDEDNTLIGIDFEPKIEKSDEDIWKPLVIGIDNAEDPNERPGFKDDHQIYNIFEEGQNVYMLRSFTTWDSAISYVVGDTWYQRYDCLKTYPYADGDLNNIIEMLSCMLETHVNLDGRYDSNRGLIDNLYMDNTNFNLINPAYNQRDDYYVQRLLDKDFYERKYFNNQFTWSVEKHVAEKIDKWINTSLTSIYNISGDNGAITALRVFNDKIFCFQENAVSNILFNYRVQIPTSDGMPIQISNNYKVEGVQLYAQQIGCINKYSISISTDGLYFIDSVTKQLMRIGEKGIDSLSVAKQMSDYFNTLPQQKCTPENYTVKTFFDSNNKDLYVMSQDESLVFSEKLNEFSSFMSYRKLPAMFNIFDNFYSIYASDVNTLYKMFAGEYNYAFEEVMPYSITYIANGLADRQNLTTLDKTFTNLDLHVDVWDYNDNLTDDFAFTKLRVWNEYQDTQDVDLADSLHNPANLKKKFRTWHIDIPRNKKIPSIVSRFGKRDRIRNQWCKVKLWNDYPKSGDRIELHDINTVFYI